MFTIQLKIDYRVDRPMVERAPTLIFDRRVNPFGSEIVYVHGQLTPTSAASRRPVRLLVLVMGTKNVVMNNTRNLHLCTQIRRNMIVQVCSSHIAPDKFPQLGRIF